MEKLISLLRAGRFFMLVGLILFFVLAVMFVRSPEDKLKASVAEAKALFLKVNTDLLASASFQEIARTGGTLVTYVKANIEDSTLGPYVMDKPTMGGVVVLRQNDNADIVIEGYLDDLAKPALTETVTVRPMDEEDLQLLEMERRERDLKRQE